MGYGLFPSNPYPACAHTVWRVSQGGCDATCWGQVGVWVVPLSWTSEEHNATAEQLGLINNFGDQENYNNYTRPIHCGSSYTVYGGPQWISRRAIHIPMLTPMME